MFSIYKRLIYKPNKNDLKIKSRAKARQLKKNIHKCELCKVEGYLEVHHKDHNALNNKPSNLIKLCLNCHIKQHASEPVANLMKKKKWYKQEVNWGPVIKFIKVIIKGLK